MNSPEILIIDDDIIMLSLLQESLKDFAVLTCSSPIEGLELLQKLDTPPYLIILDLRMPEMNGFELCLKIREFLNEEKTAIIFHTATSDLEERLRGYEVGANDFLIKPIEISELKKKARTIVTKGKELRQIQSETESHSVLMKSVLSDLTEQSLLIHFFRASIHIFTIPSLLKLIVKSATDFGLKSSVQAKFVMNDIGYQEVATNEEFISELEHELLDRLTYSERIMTRGKRLFLNYPPFTQIIKNMPDDPAQAGRFRDHLAIILEAAIAKYKAILQSEEVNLMVEELEVLQLNLDKENTKKTQRVLMTLTELVDSVERNIFEYGLTEAQESQLLEIFKSSTDKAYATIDDSISKNNLSIVMQRLKVLREINHNQGEDKGVPDDFELF